LGREGLKIGFPACYFVENGTKVGEKPKKCLNYWAFSGQTLDEKAK
jgi:hypothetical protein